MSSSEFRRDQTAPFLVKLFYRTGAFHRPDEFSSAASLPHLDIHTWRDCTLLELAQHILGETSPRILPDPAIGTRLCFRLVYADSSRSAPPPPPPTRVGHHQAPPPPPPPPLRYVAKDLGSVVLGGGGPGAGPDEGLPDDGGGDDDDGAKTLADARFVAGDYLSCAILPPDELTGDVAPASSARVGRGAGVGEAKGSMGPPPPPPPPQSLRAGGGRDYGAPSSVGFRGRGARGGGGYHRGYGRGGYYDRDYGFGRGDGGVPEGEWRRGDRLPDPPREPGRWGR